MSRRIDRNQLVFFRSLAVCSLLGCLFFVALGYWRGDELGRVQIMTLIVAGIACLVTFGAFGPESDNDARR